MINFFKKNKKIIFICFIICILISINLISRNIIFKNEYDFESLLLSHKEQASIIYFFVSFLQPIIIPIPETVTILIGSSVLGSFYGAVIGFVGTLLGIVTMYLVSQLFSSKIRKLIENNSDIKKFNNYRQKNNFLVVIGLFILPILPDEIICIGSGITKIKFHEFIIAAIISKLLTTFVLSYSTKLVKFDNILIVILVIFVLYEIIKLIVTNQRHSEI